MRSANSPMNAAESSPAGSRWLGSKLMPNSGPVVDRVERPARVTKSNAISVGCTSSAKRTPSASKTSRIGFQRSANSLYPRSIFESVGGNE